MVHYARSARRKWICKSCGYEFSVTAGTILADRKMSFGDPLLAIFLFVCVFRRKRPGVSVQTAHRFGDFGHPPHGAGGRAAS